MFFWVRVQKPRSEFSHDLTNPTPPVVDLHECRHWNKQRLEQDQPASEKKKLIPLRNPPLVSAPCVCARVCFVHLVNTKDAIAIQLRRGSSFHSVSGYFLFALPWVQTCPPHTYLSYPDCSGTNIYQFTCGLPGAPPYRHNPISSSVLYHLDDL